jgi:hypothetical protein
MTGPAGGGHGGGDYPDYTPVGPIHVEAVSDEGYNVVVMRCGLVAIIDNEGVPSPPVDWYAPCAAENATCDDCRSTPEQGRVDTARPLEVVA